MVKRSLSDTRLPFADSGAFCPAQPQGVPELVSASIRYSAVSSVRAGLLFLYSILFTVLQSERDGSS